MVLQQQELLLGQTTLIQLICKLLQVLTNFQLGSNVYCIPANDINSVSETAGPAGHPPVMVHEGGTRRKNKTNTVT